MSIILLGHAKISKFEAPDQPSYDRYSPDLHDSAATTVEEWADAVFFANYQTFVTKEKEAFGKQTPKATGNGARIVYTQERPPHRAKNRFNLPYEMPMSYAAFVRHMGEGLNAMIKNTGNVVNLNSEKSEESETTSGKKGSKKKSESNGAPESPESPTPPAAA